MRKLRLKGEEPWAVKGGAVGHRKWLCSHLVEVGWKSVLWQVFRQVGEEKHVGNVHAVGVLMGMVVERIMMQKNISLEGPPNDKSAEMIQDWLFKTLFPGVLKAASRCIYAWHYTSMFWISVLGWRMNICMS